MIKSFMNEIKRDFINSENKSHIILNKTQPELVPCIEDTSIIEKRHLPQIIELTKKARKERRDLSFALSGTLQPDKQIFPVDLIPPTVYPETIHLLNGFSKPWNTNVDINHLITNYPNDRWKFYLSMENKTTEQRKKINLFFLECAKRCSEKKVALLTKNEDHPYDNPDVYTWQPITMARILKDLYQDQKFSEIWSSVNHPFQRPIPGISENHIGLVQEPIAGLNGYTHSARMAILGNTILKLLPLYDNKLKLHVFVQACYQAGVRPTEPWRISESALSTNNKEIYERHGVKA